MGGAQAVRERRVGGRGGVEDHHRLDPDRATGTARDALEGRDAMGCREVGTAARRRGGDDRDPDRLAVGDERARGREQGVEERLVAGLELAAAVERDRAGHAHAMGHPPATRSSGGVTFFIGGRSGPSCPPVPGPPPRPRRMNRATASGAATNGAM